jgi:filamentous hemagglutinin family protein
LKNKQRILLEGLFVVCLSNLLYYFVVLFHGTQSNEVKKNMSKPSVIFINALLLFSVNLYAEVVTDGTLGPRSNLTPEYNADLDSQDYQIGADLGQQRDGNLFHSFQEFNLNSNESATFDGPNHIKNVISRVTGGNPSNIDGPIYSEMLADFYFLNPDGIVFGPNASLNVQGSFHASTAHYLLLGENERFYSSLGNKSILSVASPTAFGFLGNAKSIEVNQSSLTVNPGKMLSLVGGDLTIDEATLFAQSGQINLVAVGDVVALIPFTASELAQNTFGLQGKISLTMSELEAAKLWEKARKEDKHLLGNVDVTGEGGGQVFIRAGQFYARSSAIFANTEGNILGANIDIAVEGKVVLEKGARITAENKGDNSAGQITIDAGEALILDEINEEIVERIDSNDTADLIESASGIFTDNLGTGTGGDIRITTPSLSIDTGLIGTATRGSGKAGDIWIDAFQIELDRNGIIDAQTVGYGQGGTLRISATDALSLTGDSILSVTSGDMGNAGRININTAHLLLSESDINSSSIIGEGNAGNINITTNTALFTQDSRVVTSSEQSSGGNITLNVRDNLHVEDSLISAEASGDEPQDSGGNITIENPKFFILDNASKLLTKGFFGAGGNIRIKADYFLKSDNPEINASSTFNQDGEVFIDAPEIDLTGALFHLAEDFQQFTFSLDRCAGLTRDTISKFLITIRDGLPPGPGDLMTDYSF